MRRPSVAEKSEIRERQERAWHLVVVRRLSEQEAAGILGVSDRTIRRDLTAMRGRGTRALRSLSGQSNVFRLATEMWTQLSAVLREAWTSVQAAPDASSVRVRALNTVRATIKDMADIMQSLGLLPKAPEEVLISARDPAQLTDHQLEAAVAFFLSLSEDRGEAEAAAGESEEPPALDRGEPADSHQG